ncbi:M56 family metallopeptidase [Pedobacter foliorum]|uniref:M56 family metallopeptidase n=1 Tax=Pedobacter foliorum TaxID=2739058 RepID=UPI001567B173|nr:M56 family metallopeptidase [Pedobacter foliorum]NRF40313.1 M56 family metallopeptidase [Pedobacter foliorum]
MMNWLYYLLEANLYLAAFYGFYRLFLHKETFYSLNRGYLIVTSIVAFIIPLLQVGYLNNLLNNQQEARILSVQVAQVTETSKALTVTDLLIFCYLSIAAFFTVKMAISIYKIILLSFNAKKQKAGKVTYVELNHSHAAFSFFNLLFLNPSVAEKHTILKHEMVHIQQKHSLDIIFFEIVQIIAWFNPITYFIKKDIKLLHEYIADDITTDNDIHKHDYAMFLIQNSFGIVPNQLANQIFNQSILKRRINMLNKERSAGRARLKLLFALPIAGGMLCASTMAFTKDYAMIDLYPEKYESTQSVKQDTSKKKATELETVRTKSGTKAKPVKFPPPIVTPDPPAAPRPKKPAGNVKFPPVKFPPPIVTPDPPAKHKKAKSLKEVKFPPPIVTPDKPVPPPPPPAEPKKDEPTSISISGTNQDVVLITNGEQTKAVKTQKITFTGRGTVATDLQGKPTKNGVNTVQKGTVTFEAKPTN